MRLPILLLAHIATAHRRDLDLTAITGAGSNASSIAATALQNFTAVVQTHGSDRGVLSQAGLGIPGKLQRLALTLAVLGGPLRAVEAKNMPIAFAADVFERANRKRRLELAPVDDLPLLRLAAILSNIAYEVSMQGLDEALRSVAGLTHTQLIKFEPQVPGSSMPQWFLLRGTALGQESLFLVFRGTESKTDILRDLICVPKEHTANGNDTMFHTGFLTGVKDNEALMAALEKEPTSGRPLYIFGHSLGGALAHVMAYGWLLPRGGQHHGPVTVCGVGAPCVLHASSAASAAGQRGARVVNIVNDCDWVPRILGSRMELTRTLLSGSDWSDTMLRSLEQYRHADSTEIFYIRDGGVYSLPKRQRASILHLQDALLAGPAALDSHSVKEYMQVLDDEPPKKRARRSELDQHD